MKKIISATLIIVFALCGCKGSTANIEPIVKGISFTAELTYYNECCEASVSVDENGAADFEIISPDTIKGLTFHFNGESLTAEYAGLEYKTDYTALPEGGACIQLYKILKDAAGDGVAVTADGDDNYILKESDVRYKLYLGATGLPIKAESAENGFSALFKNVTIQKSGS